MAKCREKAQRLRNGYATVTQAKPEAAKVSRDKPSGYSVPAVFEEVDGFAAALAGWIEMRKAKKNPPTGNAIQILINRLAKRPADAVAALQMGTERGWSGLEWEWFDRDRPKTSGLRENIKAKTVKTYGNNNAT